MVGPTSRCQTAVCIYALPLNSAFMVSPPPHFPSLFFSSTINFNFLCWLHFSSFCGRVEGGKRKQERYQWKAEENMKGGREWWEGKKKASRKTIKGGLSNGVKALPQRSGGGRDHCLIRRATEIWGRERSLSHQPGQQRPAEVDGNSELL